MYRSTIMFLIRFWNDICLNLFAINVFYMFFYIPTLLFCCCEIIHYRPFWIKRILFFIFKIFPSVSVVNFLWPLSFPFDAGKWPFPFIPLAVLVDPLVGLLDPLDKGTLLWEISENFSSISFEILCPLQSLKNEIIWICISVWIVAECF